MGFKNTLESAAVQLVQEVVWLLMLGSCEERGDE